MQEIRNEDNQTERENPPIELTEQEFRILTTEVIDDMSVEGYMLPKAIRNILDLKGIIPNSGDIRIKVGDKIFLFPTSVKDWATGIEELT